MLFCCAMLRFTRSVFVCVSLGLLVGCGDSWPTDHEGLESHFTEHRAGMAELAAALEASDYVSVQLGRGARVYVEQYPGGRSQVRALKGAELRRWRRLFWRARTGFVFIDDLGIVNLDARHTIAGDEGFVWSVRYRRKPGYLYPDPICRDDHRDAPCGRCRVDMDESWAVFFEWLPDILDIQLIRESIEGDMTRDESQERRETVFQACAAATGRTFDLPERG